MKRATCEGPEGGCGLELEGSLKLLEAVEVRRLRDRPRGLKVETDILLIPRKVDMITTCYRNISHFNMKDIKAVCIALNSWSSSLGAA